MHKILLLTILAIVLLSSIAISDDDTTYNISTLSWLAGDWRGEFEGNRFECHYTTPEGGAIMSVSKEFHEGKPCYIEFEKFVQREDQVVLTPYPGGNKSVDFILTDYEPSDKKAKFANLEHDFPTEIIYEIVSEGKMLITVAGDHDSKRVELKVNLDKVK